MKDGRVFEKVTEDVHHKAGMQCIDCHVSQEIMGDGKTYKHEASALKRGCADCHTQGKPKKANQLNMDNIAVKDYVLRGYIHSTSDFLVTKKASIPLVNTYINTQGNAVLVSKISKKEHPINSSCLRDDVHQKVSCSMCHTTWAPTCVGSNTKFVRWYAPNAAHTTTKSVRDCASCHTNSQALGFGRGTLNYTIKGKKVYWEFTSYYANAPQDGLP